MTLVSKEIELPLLLLEVERDDGEVTFALTDSWLLKGIHSIWLPLALRFPNLCLEVVPEEIKGTLEELKLLKLLESKKWIPAYWQYSLSEEYPDQEVEQAVSRLVDCLNMPEPFVAITLYEKQFDHSLCGSPPPEKCLYITKDGCYKLPWKKIDSGSVREGGLKGKNSLTNISGPIS